MMCFHFWQPECFNEDYRSFTSDTDYARGRFVGTSENVGHDMTFKILNNSINKIISRSAARPADDDKSPKIRAYPLTYMK